MGCGASILELGSERVLQLGRPVVPFFTVVVYAGVSLPRRKGGTLILLVYWSLAGLYSVSMSFITEQVFVKFRSCQRYGQHRAAEQE